MKFDPEKIGAALAKAVKKTSATMAQTKPAPAAAVSSPPIYRTNLRNVPVLDDLPRKDGWVDAQVQILIDKATADANHLVGWTVLKPGGRHARHRLRACDSFFIVIKGRGHVYSDLGEEPAGEGEVIYSPRGAWHGFNNTSTEDVVLVWGVMGAGSLPATGYEVDPN